MADTTKQAQWPSTRSAWTVTTLLLFAYILSFVDRQILNLLAEPIRADLGLSDLDMSFLQGPAFVATYILLSLPLGQLSDSVNRTKLLAVGLGFWTMATMACGFAKSFTHLAIARAAVGTGEAALTPTAWSLLADSFPPEKRATPVSLYLTGPYVGGGLALIFGAQILGIFDAPVVFGDWIFQPWQICFILVSAPGLLLVLAMSLTKEPARQLTKDDNPKGKGLREFGAQLKSQWKIYAGIWFGAGQLAVMLYGLQAWTPTYLMRVHGWSISEAGFSYGIVALVAGSAGVLNGPIIHRWLLRKTGKDCALYIGMACGLLLAPIGLLITIVPGAYVLVVIAVLSYLVTTPMTLMTTTLQMVTPNLFRGRASGVHVVATNVLGLGFGPTFVAFLTEKVFQDANMVGESMSAQFVVFGLGAAACYMIGASALSARTSPTTAAQTA